MYSSSTAANGSGSCSGARPRRRRGRAVVFSDVQRQDLARPRRGLIQQPPQRLLAHRNVITPPEALELHERDRPRPIRRLTPTRQHIGKRFGHPALAGAERRERPQRREVTIPRRRRAPTPRPDSGPLQLATGDPFQRTLGSELAPKAAERLRIGASAREREIGLSEERIDGLSKGRRLLPRRTQPPTRPPRRAHRRECVIFTGPGGVASASGRWRNRGRSRGE
jgi:hypothetical protein